MAILHHRWTIPSALPARAPSRPLIYAGHDAQGWLEPARALIAAEGVTSGVTCLPGVLIGRWLGPDARTLRTAYARFAARLRVLVAGLPERLPTVWST